MLLIAEIAPFLLAFSLPLLLVWIIARPRKLPR